MIEDWVRRMVGFEPRFPSGDLAETFLLRDALDREVVTKVFKETDASGRLRRESRVTTINGQIVGAEELTFGRGGLVVHRVL